MFESSTRNTVGQVPTSGSSPSTAITDAVHTGTAVPACPKPQQRLQAQVAPHIVNEIAAPNPATIPAPPAPSTALPSVISRGRQMKVFLQNEIECMEAGEFQSSMLNAF